MITHNRAGDKTDIKLYARSWRSIVIDVNFSYF